MIETLTILVDLQFEFHLLLESWHLLEWESPRDYFREVEINNQAMEQLTRFQFYQDLHHRQYCLADRLPLPWEELPLVQILTPENWKDT